MSHLSHEIRTPLQGMTGIAEGMLDLWDRLSSAQLKEHLKHVVSCQNALLSLIVNLLDLAKFKSGELRCDITEADVTRLMIDVITEFKSSHIHLKIAPGVRQIIYCDYNKIRQVLRNLINNAIKYAGTDKPVDIVVSPSKSSSTHIHIYVHDQGPGIPESEAEYIFQPFCEGSKIRQKSRDSMGLGLSICKEIVLAHGGNIWVEPNLPAGASFVFSLRAKETSLPIKCNHDIL